VTDEVNLRTETTGRVARILIEEAQWVNKGEVLIEIANEQYQFQVDLAQAELDVATAELQRLINGARQLEREELQYLHQAKISEYQRAQKTWDAVEGMRETHAITQTEIDRHYYQLLTLQSEVAAAKARLELINAQPRDEDIAIARAKVALAQSRLDLARDALERTQLRAPLDGQILELNVKTGESTGPNATLAAVVMANTSSFFVDAYLDEYDALRVPLGCVARIKADCLPNDLQGRMMSLSPIMGRKKFATNQPNELNDIRTRKVRIQLDQGENLITGLPVDVYFEIQTPSLTNDQ
jgi:multidrug resistance efflux pump